jgi:predicted MFS family arabinose efflux permease
MADVNRTATGDLRAARLATTVAFIGAGFAFASWASRIPAVRERLDLSPSALGLVLFAIAAGSITSLPMSGSIIARIGCRRTLAIMAVILGVGLLVVAFGYSAGIPVLATGLFLLGFATGGWDVAMNVHAAAVEQHLDRPIMSRFHAGYSLGTVGGALVGAAAVALHVSITIHLASVAVIVVIVTSAAARRFMDERASFAREESSSRTRSAWRERRTLLIGVFVLAFAFAEGTANDWISVAAIDGYGASGAVAGVVYALFLSSMSIGRWFGPALLTRYGRVPVVRTLGALGTVGVLLFVFSPSLAAAVVGAVLWGAGVSLGFPVGMSAGADEPRHAAARVSVISSIGYCAFLAGPPLIGLLGDNSSTLHALATVALLLGISVAVATATARPDDAAVDRDGHVPRRSGPIEAPGA